MKKIFAMGVLFTLLNIKTATSCTTFFLEKNGQMVFGRNYDWVTATCVINTNLRGLLKETLPLEKGNILKWTSKYGSVTFNQYGKEFPNGGMNEAGLVVELMWLDDTRYPAPDNRPAISVLQWIQYQLDNCSNVNEVIASDKKIRVASTGTPQHYLVADAKGGVATIEFLNGKMVVHSGKSLPYPVLANSPYNASAESMKALSSTKNGASSFQNNSIERFTKACSMVQEYKQTTVKKPLVDYSFDILNKVSQGNFTKWSIVYDITNKKVFFKSLDHQQIKSLDITAFDFSCTATPKAFNMNQNVAGNVNTRFTNYTNDQNRNMLKQAFDNSKSEVNIPDALKDAMVLNAASVKCK